MNFDDAEKVLRELDRYGDVGAPRAVRPARRLLDSYVRETDLVKTVVLAMNNPVSDDDAHALYPHPPGCAGHRLWTMMREHSGAPDYPSRADYLAGLERRNVLHARTWSDRDARAAGAALRPALTGRRVVVLGVATLAALGLPRPTDWGVWWSADRHPPSEADCYCLLPHPSGRCREYNSPDLRRRAAHVLLAELERGRVGA